LCQLEKKIDSLPAELSGGQQQRVAIAMALANEPDVLLLDEPFSHLDISLKDQIRNEMIDIIRSAGVTTIMATHDPKEAMSCTDRIMILRNGQIQQFDNPQKIYNCPNSYYCAQLMGDINLINLPDYGQIMVRPEDIQIGPQGAFKGEVARVQFLGAYFKMYLTSSISSGQVVIYSSTSYGPGSILQFNINTTHPEATKD